MQDAPTERGRLRGSDYLVLALLCLAYYGFVLIHPRTLTSHETTHCQNVVEMLASGDWLIPTYGGRTWLERPPVPHWCTGLFVAIFGTGEGAMRFGSMVAGLLCVWLSARMAALWYGRAMGLVTGAILATMREFAQYAMGPEAEIFLCLLVTIAAAVFVELEFVHRPKDPRESTSFFGRRPALVLGFAVAAGLTNWAKGPLFGTFFLALPLVLLFAWDRDWTGFRRYLWFWGGLAYAVIGAGWPLIAYLRHPDVLDLWRSDFGDRWNKGYIGEPAWYYVQALPWNIAPWTLAAGFGLVITARKAFREGARPERYLWCWAIGPAVLLSLFQGKHHHYLLPTLLPWAVLSALGVVRVWHAVQAAPAWQRHPLTSLTLVGIPVSVAVFFLSGRGLGLGWMRYALIAIGPITALWLWAILRQTQFHRAFVGLVALVVIVSNLSTSARFELYDRPRNDAAFVEEIRRRTSPKETLYVMGDLHPLNASWYLYYLRDRAELLHNHSFLTSSRLPSSEFHVIDRAYNLPVLQQFGTVEAIAQTAGIKYQERDRWTLFRLRLRDDLVRANDVTRISPMQATGRAPGPFLH